MESLKLSSKLYEVITLVFTEMSNLLIHLYVLLTAFFTNSALRLEFKKTGRKVKLGQKIAEGGFSYVYLATDEKSQCFAVKKILVQNNDQKKNVDKEIRIMESLKHPNILNLIDEVKTSHEKYIDVYNHYILLPFIQQGTLQDITTRLLYNAESLNEAQVWSIFYKVLKGVQYMHSLPTPLAHRDLKLGNILIDADFNPRIMDFGSVSKARVFVRDRKEAIALTDLAETHCTNAYRPPELFDCPSGIKIDERTDIWSLGCVLYAMVFGETPFETDDGSIAISVLSGNVNLKENNKFSKEFEEIIRWLLNFEISSRPFIGEVIERVERISNVDLNH